MARIYTPPNLGTNPTSSRIIAGGLLEARTSDYTLYSSVSIDGVKKAWYYNTATDIRVIYNAPSDCIVYQAVSNSDVVTTISKTAGITTAECTEGNILEYYVEIYPDYESAYNDISSGIPITYYLTNCSAPSAPTSVQPGGTVSFPVTVSPGYNIFNPVQGGSISVYQGNDYIPFTFENGQLTFTAPGGG